jgi:hypothetical protein
LNAKRKYPKSYKEDEEAVQLAKEVFEFFDDDGSGMLDLRELEIAQNVLQSLGAAGNLDSAGVASGFWADCNLDVDGSGDVDLEEWARFVESVYQILGRKQFISVIAAWLAAARAATHTIQAVRRGNRQRRRSQPEHQLTTVDEVWDLLTRVEGTYGQTITVGDFVDVFQCAKDTGLDSELAITAPVTDEGGMAGGTKVEDVLPEQVCRLCELVLDGDVETMTDGEVWFELATAKSDRLTVGQKDELLRRDLRERKIDHGQFDRILPILARALSLDKQIILSHILWLKTKVFEAPAPLLALVVQQCANNKNERQSKEEAYRGVPNVSILDLRFKLIEYVKLVVNGHLVEERDNPDSWRQCQTGIPLCQLQQPFLTVSRHLQERVAARTELRKEAHPRYMGKVPTMKKLGRDEQDGFEGAEAFQVLMEELFKLCPAGKFVSPLAMIVHMIRQGTENPLLSEENIVAKAALAVKLRPPLRGPPLVAPA